MKKMGKWGKWSLTRLYIILGPLLFLIFVNDLQYATRLFKPIMLEYDDKKKFFETANSKLQNVNDCCFPNKLF